MTEDKYHFVNIGRPEPFGPGVLYPEAYEWCLKRFGGLNAQWWIYYGDGLYGFTELIIATEFKLLWG